MGPQPPLPSGSVHDLSYKVKPRKFELPFFSKYLLIQNKFRESIHDLSNNYFNSICFGCVKETSP